MSKALEKVPKLWKQQECFVGLFSKRVDFFYSRMLKNINFYVCSGTGCVRLTSTDCKQISRSEVLELACSHEKADTRHFLHAAHAAYAAQSRESTTIIKSPDTDVAVIGMYAASLDVLVIFSCCG